MSVVSHYLIRSRDVLQSSIDDPEFGRSIEGIADIISQCIQRRGKLLTLGNGGSAGDAQHIAGEFVSRLNYDRGPMAAIALTTDTSVITAVANDYGYEHVFERQILALGREGDVLLAISTSGLSRSVLRAMDAARTMRMSVVGFTGLTGGDMPSRADLMLHAPSDATPLIQQIHITAAHIICGIVEAALFPVRSEK